MSSVTIKEPYVVGEKPAPLDYQFLDADGNPINITSWSAEFHYQEQYGSPMVVSATISDGPNGKARRTFTGTEFTTPGRYTGQFWVGNGTNRYTSILIKFTVAASIGAVPTI